MIQRANLISCHYMQNACKLVFYNGRYNNRITQSFNNICLIFKYLRLSLNKANNFTILHGVSFEEGYS